MSLLNLNTPAGRGPRGKGSSRAWMGIGLVVAVLGIGSTFASSITLNSPGGTTEFGQGVTQTVYCGGDQSVTVTPTSTYTNASNSVKIKVVTPKVSGQPITTGTTKQTISSKDSTSFPKWLTRTSTLSGYWLSSANGSLVSSYPANISAALSLANGSNAYFFVPEYSSGTYYKGDSSSSWVEYTVQTSDETSGFKLGGVVISKIPDECSGVDFIVSGYGQTGGAQTLVANSGGSISITEVAALWTNSSSSVTPSRSRYSAVSTSGLVSASQTSSTLSFVFVPGSNGTVLSAPDLVKVVVETQEDVLGSSS